MARSMTFDLQLDRFAWIFGREILEGLGIQMAFKFLHAIRAHGMNHVGPCSRHGLSENKAQSMIFGL